MSVPDYQESISSGREWTGWTRQDLLTNTEDVEAESLCYRFTNQLVRKTVEANSPCQVKGSLFFILQGSNKPLSTPKRPTERQCSPELSDAL